VHCKLPDSSAVNPARVTVKGITDRTNAWRYGMFRAKVNRYRRMFPKATVELEGRFVKRGDLVPVAHPLITLGRSADIAGFDAGTRRLTLTEPTKLNEGETYYLVLKRRDGSAWGPVLVTGGASGYELVADEADLAAAIAAGGDWADFIVTIEGDMEPTVAVWGKAGEYAQDCLLIGARAAGGERMVLELQADDPRVHDESGDGEPPEEDEIDTLPPAATAPDVTGLKVSVGGTRFTPELVTSIDRSPGAEGYILQITYDHLTWRTLQVGDATAWSGPVEATTVWLRWTAIGVLRGAPAEWFMDLTATEAVPAAVTVTGVQVFFKSAWINLGYPDEDGIEGVIAKLSVDDGFDPEVAGDIAYDGTPISRIPIDISAAGTIHVRVAAYNRFGKVNLTWAPQVAITAAKVEGANLSAALTAEIEKIAVNETAIANEQTVRAAADAALASEIGMLSAVVDGNAAAIVTEATARADGDSANATAITTVQTTVDGHTASISTISESVDGIGARHVVKTTVEGHVAGTELANGGPGLSAMIFLVDKFLIANASDPDAQPFEFKDGVLTVTEAVFQKAAVEYLAAHWAEIGTLVTGRIQSADGFMFIDFNDKVFEIA
ncbi:MAG: hypothetical protein KKB37_04755, partial [Alphaproteobacteria bacterium]|nr:hypothetical protein [Alphaproteobacteria bacterium]